MELSLLWEELAEVRLRGYAETELNAPLVLGVDLDDGPECPVVGLAQHETAGTGPEQFLYQAVWCRQTTAGFTSKD